MAVNVPLSTLTISELSDFQIIDWSAPSGLTMASNSIEVPTSISRVSSTRVLSELLYISILLGFGLGASILNEISVSDVRVNE